MKVFIIFLFLVLLLFLFPGVGSVPLFAAGSDYTLFSRSIFSDQPILPTTNPSTSPKEILHPGEYLRLFSARGEEESTSAAIFNSGTLPLKKVNVQVSPLTEVTDQTKTLPGAEIRSVKVIRYRKDWRQENTEPSVMYPAVLIPYTPKHINAGEFDVPVNQSKEWWITVRIPDTASPGVYAGTITIDPGEPINAPTTTIPIRITVSGVKLLTSSQISGFYYKPPNDYLDCTKDPCTSVKPYDYTDIASLSRFREITRDNFALMKRMGMQTVVPVAPLILLWNETAARVDFNLAFLETVLDEAKQAGLASYPIPIYQVTNFNLDNGIREKYQNHGISNPDQLDQLAEGGYKRAVQAMDALGKAKQITLYYYPIDEPFGNVDNPPVPEELAWLKKSVSLIRSAVPGAQIWTTISFSEWFNRTTSAQLRAEFNPFIDIQVYNGAIGKTGALSITGKTKIRDHLRDSGDIGYTYLNRYLGTPYDHRTEHGLFLWNLPLKGNTPWIFQFICKDPYQDELDCDINRGDWLYAYPDPDDNYKLLPALNLYGVREGVDDNRYLYTLREAIRQSTNTIKKQEAQTLLNKIDNTINRNTPNTSNIKQNVPSYQLDTWRRQIAELILELGQPVSPTRTPTPTIVRTVVDNSNKFIWVSSPGRQFTDEERSFLAGQYNMVVIGNAHGNWDFPSYNAEAVSLKNFNPDLEVYPYYNTTYRFDKTNYGDDTFKNEWLLKDTHTNQPIPKETSGDGQNYYLDLTNSQYRTWAVNLIKDWVTSAPYAGIALDQFDPIGGADLEAKIGQAKIDGWNNGLQLFLNELRSAMGSKKIIYNGVKDYAGGDRNLTYFNRADLALDENYCYNRRSGSMSSKSKLLEDIKMMIDNGKNNKGFLLKTNYFPRDPGDIPPAPSELKKIARYCLATFMMGNQTGLTYFKFGPGYRTDLGEINDNALESGLNFGKPIGDYQIEGKSLKRKFDNGWIFINFESTPENVRVPERLIYANGGVEGHVYSAGDELVLRPHDAAFLLKSAAFIAPTPTTFISSTPPVPSATGLISPTITLSGPTVTSGPSPTSPSGGGILNYDLAGSLSFLSSNPLNILGGIVLLFFLLY